MAIHLHRNDLPDGLTLGPIVAIDTETLGLNPHRDRLCLIQLADGGGDDPETSLEALALAIKSDWLWGLKSRQLIVLWTDTSAHPLEHNLKAKPANYPPDMPPNFSALTDLWGDQNHVDTNAKRLVLYAPEATPWPTIADHWENVLHYPSQAGRGLEELEYNEILDHIAQSV